jgi:hypothetical protein
VVLCNLATEDGHSALSWRIFNFTDGSLQPPDDYISYYYEQNLTENHGSRITHVNEEELITTVCALCLFYVRWRHFNCAPRIAIVQLLLCVCACFTHFESSYSQTRTCIVMT